MHHPGYVFGVVDVVTAFFARAKLRGPLFDIGVELVGVVEGGHHDVSALPPIRVIAVVLNDPAIDGVIIRVHLGHGGSIRAASDPNLVRRYWARIELAFWTRRVVCESQVTRLDLIGYRPPNYRRTHRLTVRSAGPRGSGRGACG
jgi:hypothetical protein